MAEGKITEFNSSNCVIKPNVLFLEDELVLGCPYEINHPIHRDIGIHFNGFNTLRYLPNAAKMAHYPEDNAFAESHLAAWVAEYRTKNVLKAIARVCGETQRRFILIE